MSRPSSYLSRRTALMHLGAMSSTLGLLGCVYPEPGGDTPFSVIEWPQLVLDQVDAQGYGTDPDLIHPSVPWPNVLSAGQCETMVELANIVLPGACEAGVVDVIHEWVSAPYPRQQRDRQLIQPGLVWLRQHNHAGQSLTELVIQLINVVDQSPNTMSMPVEYRFIERFRFLVTGAYFSSAQGVLELGYAGNRPIAGDYPGPSDEAEQHLQDLLKRLDLPAV